MEHMKKQLLTIEQSLQLRIEMQNMEEKFEKMISSKNDEIKLLKQQNEILQNTTILPEIKKTNQDNSEILKLLKNEIVEKNINILIELSRRSYGELDIESTNLSFLLVNDLIERHKNFNNNWIITDKGKKLIKEYFNTKNEN